MTRSLRILRPLAAAFLVSAALPAVAADLRPVSDDPVFFRGWQFRTDVVQSNADRYNETMGGHVDYQTVTGDYPSITESGLIAGADLDIIYANPSTAYRYHAGGWIVPADDLPVADEVMADLYPGIRSAWSSADGKLLGLSYFVTTRGLVQVNLKKYGELGLTDENFPATWDALYDQLASLREGGVEVPYLPHWYNEWSGLPWAFTFEVLNRGGEVANASHQPALTVDGAGGETLRDWKAVFNSGLVPKDVITWNQAAYLQAWGSGRYVYSPQSAYDLKTFNDPAESQIAGNVSFLPYRGQSWGLIDSALYLVVKRDRTADQLENAKRFASWYGYQDQDGEPSVALRWLDEAMLFSAYKSVMESDHAAEAIKAGLSRPDDYAALLELYAQTPYPTGSWNVVWSEEFNSWLKDELQLFLSEDRDVAATIEAINAKITALNEEHGI